MCIKYQIILILLTVFRSNARHTYNNANYHINLIDLELLLCHGIQKGLNLKQYIWRHQNEIPDSHLFASGTPIVFKLFFGVFVFVSLIKHCGVMRMIISFWATLLDANIVF